MSLAKCCMLTIFIFFRTDTEVIPQSSVKQVRHLCVAALWTTANSDSRATVPSYVINYLFELWYLTIKVTLASERKLILSYFSYNTWTAAIQENGEFYIKISNELKIFHPCWLVADAETMKSLKVRNAMLILRVVLLSKNARFLLKASLAIMIAEKQLNNTICENIQKKHSECWGFF